MTSISATAANVAPEEYDLVVIGTGEGSKFVAWTLARQGWRVAVVERRWIGGSCPNIACLPSKNIIHSAKVASYFARAAEFGIETADYKINMQGIMDRKRGMVKALVDVHLGAFESSGAELILGQGHFIAPKTVRVDLNDGGARHLRGRHVLIGTGTRATIDAIPGLSEAKPLTHIEALELDAVPEHLLVLGGGYIGLEFAQAMRRFGSKVSIIERNHTVLHREDPDVVSAMGALLCDEGIEVILDAKIQGVAGLSGHAVAITYRQGAEQKRIEGTHVLVAAGRTPNTDGIGLELARVELTERGYVKVNERLETTAAGVWAIGEAAGSPLFTHIALDDFRVVRDNLLGGNRVTTGRLVPYSLFTDPELAHVGLSEREAQGQGISYRLFKIPMLADLRTRTLSETRGFMKALVGDDERILGFTVFGVSGGEIMSAIQIAMIGGLPYTAVRDAVLAHPTLIEGLIVLFSSAPTFLKAGA